MFWTGFLVGVNGMWVITAIIMIIMVIKGDIK